MPYFGVALWRLEQTSNSRGKWIGRICCAQRDRKGYAFGFGVVAGQGKGESEDVVEPS